MDRQRLELVAGIEDTKDVGVEVAAGVLGGVSDFVDQLAGTGFADAAAAEIVAWALPCVPVQDGCID